MINMRKVVSEYYFTSGWKNVVQNLCLGIIKCMLLFEHVADSTFKMTFFHQDQSLQKGHSFCHIMLHTENNYIAIAFVSRNFHNKIPNRDVVIFAKKGYS
ncbi:hypothetical protein L1987_48142 [Smallanthus sonchifolius]|uniref:Uncharacterized protein n=1 Tax=Smallanthus sonchifolius TaxID=185202 RepID=A0ACB9FQZ6_9ASTR|nr:hypothetical protein L1987_48142 [Smallanthus sonchifolius]